MENTSNTQQFPNNCQIKIEYKDSIRSIDLENLLTGFRMIYQHEMANRTSGKSRDFTNDMRIESIEKGSIIINIIFDVNVDDIVQTAFVLGMCETVSGYIMQEEYKPEKIVKYVKNIKTAIQNVISLSFSYHHKKSVFKKDKDGNIVELREETKISINKNDND